MPNNIAVTYAPLLLHRVSHHIICLAPSLQARMRSAEAVVEESHTGKTRGSEVVQCCDRENLGLNG